MNISLNSYGYSGAFAQHLADAILRDTAVRKVCDRPPGAEADLCRPVETRGWSNWNCATAKAHIECVHATCEDDILESDHRSGLLQY